MKAARILALVVIAIMGANMANVLLNSGMHHGVGFDTFLAGSGDPWQLFINNDLVTGLLFMVGWMIFREKGGRTLGTVAWVWMAMWWGNIVVAAYVLRAAGQANGDWSRFFLGRRAGVATVFSPAAPIRALCALSAITVLIWTIFGIRAAGFSPIPTFGYIMGFAPIVLSFALVALPPRRDISGNDHVRAHV